MLAHATSSTTPADAEQDPQRRRDLADREVLQRKGVEKIAS